MGLRINTNIAAMNAYRNLSVTSNEMSDSLAKLSSGYRINKAADDAAGLAISEGLRSQIGGLKVAGRNTQDAINVVQTADGALNETTSILQRMRDLSVQASNDGGLDTNAKSDIQTEMTQLKSELDRIANTTQFNGKKLLDGSYQGTFQVGANAGETIAVNISTSMGSTGLGVSGVDVTASGAYTTAGASANVVETNADASTTAGKLEFTATNSGDFSADLSAFQSLDGTISFGGKTLDLSSVDYSVAAADTDKSGDVSASEALAQLNKAAKATFGLTNGPFTLNSAALDFSVTDAVSGYTAANGYALSTSAQDIAKATPTFTAASGASAAINTINDAITTVSTVRANLGAYQNRFQHTINNINVAVENLSASESSIRDTDMASEMVNFTRTQILSQAGTAMLAQANQIPSGVLKLLG